MNRLYPVDIRDHWDDIKQDVVDLQERYNFEWRPEDVYHECRSGDAYLYFGDKPGFIIFKEQSAEYTGEKELFVWMVCVPGMGNIDEYYEDYTDIARRIGATKIVWSSPRKAFERLAKRNHWKVRTTIYEMEMR
jgi:hypothetical protein